MIALIPLIVAGGVVQKFSNAFLGEPKNAKVKGKKKTGATNPALRRRANYPSKNRPF